MSGSTLCLAIAPAIRRAGRIGALAATFVLAACGGVKPPMAERIEHVTEIHGERLADDYYWLRERDNPAANEKILKYLNDENAYTARMTSHTEGLRERLFQEICARIKETDSQPPVPHGEYHYYWRTEQGKQYPLHCRKKGSLDAPEQILLDENALAGDLQSFSLGAFDVSPDHRLLAYSTDTSGGETYTLRIKNLDTGELYPDTIEGIDAAFAWAADNRTFFYMRFDATHRPYQVWRHTLNMDSADDKLVFEDLDEKYFVSVDLTKSEAYVVIGCNSKITSEMHLIDARRPESQPVVIAPRKEGVEYSVDHQGDWLYIVTNENALDFKLMRTSVTKPAEENWREVLPHRPGVKIDGLDVFRDYLVLTERGNANIRMRVLDGTTFDSHMIDFPDPVYTVSTAANPDFNRAIVRLGYSSLTRSRTVYEYDMTKRALVTLKQDEVVGGHNPDDYVSERLWAVAADGVKVPISLVYHKGVRRDGSNPMYLTAYGAYGLPFDPEFSISRISMLKRGFIYAIAHIRGGNEMGRGWYEDGKFLKKKNSFTDFIACAKHLIREGYTNEAKLAISGGSAGGLLIGAVVNMRPDLFKAAVADVPFVDVINTMLDPTIPLTVTEYDEWGNPNDSEYFRYMRSYSPYDNVRPVHYPDLLITAGLNDPRVQYWEPAKWTARLRATRNREGLVLLKTLMGSGHMGQTGRYAMFRDIAFEYAFAIDRTGAPADPVYE